MRKIDPGKHDQKRWEILAAAERCFHRGGIRGTAIAQICAEAKMSPGHLYHYFESKEAIIAALIDLRLEAAADRLEQKSNMGCSVFELVLAEMTGSTMERYRLEASLLFEMLAEAPRNPDISGILESHSRRIRDLLTDKLRQSQAKKEIRSTLDAQATASALIGILDGAMATMLRDPTMKADAALKPFEALLETLLAPPGAPL